MDTVADLWMRRKWVAILTLAGVFVAVVSVTMSLPDIYRSTATVAIQTQQVSEAFVQPLVTAELATRIQTIRQDVMSRTRLAELIMRLDLYPELRKKGVPFDSIIAQLRHDIALDPKGVDPQLGGRNTPTIAFEISYTGRDPQTVAHVANVLASFYIEQNSEIRAGQAARTVEILKSELADVKQELDAQERRTSEFKLSHMGELPQQVEANLASLERLNTQLRLNGENQIRDMDRRDRLEKQLADARVSAPADAPGASPRAAQLAKLREDLNVLRRQFTDEYPDVVRLRAEIATLERQREAAPAASDVARSLDPQARLVQAIADVDTELRALKDEEVTLHQAITGYERRVENVPKRQEEYDALSRDNTTTRERYAALLKRYEDAELAQNLEQGQKLEQFRLLDAAVPPREPVAPARLGLLIAGFVFSLAAAAGMVIAVEKLDTSFHSIDDLRSYVRLPALFSIPRILTAADRRRRWLRFTVVGATALVGLVLIVAGSHYVAKGNEQIVRLLVRGH
jgi:polysaccharide chain length determinant protein (PEP-CTERM system associated)